MSHQLMPYRFKLPVDKEQLLEAANTLDLDNKVIPTLLHFTEVEIEVYIDTKTGKVSNIKVV